MKKILVCGGPGCVSSNSERIIENINKALKEHGLSKKVKVLKTGCFGFCEEGPVVKILPDNTFYVKVKPEDGERIVVEDIISEKKLTDLLYIDEKTGERVLEEKQIPFYQKQEKIALRNCGLIDPEVIEQYIEKNGYKALEKAIKYMDPVEVISTVIESGLRGRGGGGFSTGKKWEFARMAKGDVKYVVCNADEGDPGAFMDRCILEGDPHSVIEGMALCAYGIGAEKGLVYIRAEYPLSIERLRKAIIECRKKGYLGKNLFGTNFSFDIEIKYGAGAFVCGEETALINSMEGKRGEPNIKPPFPAEKGYWGKPTNVNNVETFSNIPAILLNGAKWFRGHGTEKSPGTKVFALAGKIKNVGLIEVPMGITLREVIYDIGGGIKDNKKFKAVQTGGPSGGCLTEEDLDTPIDFDTLIAKGSMMGSGGMIVMDEDDCIVSMAKFYLEFTEDESCGKCTPCRIGNTRLWEILNKITQGKGEERDLELLKELSETIKSTSLCGLGQSSPNPVLSTLAKFKDEYLAHIRDKKCPASQCKALRKYFINEKCVGCTGCSRVCPVACIDGKVKEAHVIDQSRCIKCGSCYEVCKFKAIDIL